MFRRYPAQQNSRPLNARFSRAPQRSLHSSPLVGGLQQLQDASTSATPASSYGPLWPFFEMHRTNGELASLRTLNDALLSVIHAHGQQPSTGCGCHSHGPCSCQHHHHQDRE